MGCLRDWRNWAAFGAAALALFFFFGAVVTTGPFGQEAAAWVQAFGSIAAIYGGFHLANRQARQSRQDAEERTEDRRKSAIVLSVRMAYLAIKRIQLTVEGLEAGVPVDMIMSAIQTDLRQVQSYDAASLPDAVLMEAYLAMPGLLSTTYDTMGKLFMEVQTSSLVAATARMNAKVSTTHLYNTAVDRFRELRAVAATRGVDSSPIGGTF